MIHVLGSCLGILSVKVLSDTFSWSKVFEYVWLHEVCIGTTVPRIKWPRGISSPTSPGPLPGGMSESIAGLNFPVPIHLPLNGERTVLKSKVWRKHKPLAYLRFMILNPARLSLDSCLPCTCHTACVKKGAALHSILVMLVASTGFGLFYGFTSV